MGTTTRALGVSCSEWNTLIDEWVFNERNRLILKRRIIDGVTYEKLSEEFDMSDRQIKKIVKTETQKLADIIIDQKMH
jgi:hypothetical protein